VLLCQKFTQRAERNLGTDKYKDEQRKLIHSSTDESLFAVKELVSKKRGRPLAMVEKPDDQVKGM